MNVRFIKEAREELRESIGYYERRGPGLGGDFRDEVQRALDQAILLPTGYPSVGIGARRVRLYRFPYSVVYLESPDAITILAIAHARRQPGYWQGRLPV